jgi:endonuclease/exonuclease/phosphatase family metal-dependent hydrolase
VKKSWWAFLTVGVAAWTLAACSSPQGERPTVDARSVVDGPPLGMIDAAPGMIDAAPGMIDAASRMIDAAPLMIDAASVMIDATPVTIDAAVDAAPVAVDAAPVVVDAAIDAAPVVVDAAIDAAPPPDAPPPPPPPPPTGPLRLMAGNLTSGNQQAYLSPGIHIFRGLAPDVAMVQEFNVGANTAADLRGFVDQAFGPEFSFVRGAPAQIPNGIISRYPIIASGEWVDTQVGNRDFVWARIDIPGPTDLFAVSVHLLTSGSGVRNVEAGELVQNIRGLPAGTFVVLGGDFNTDSRSEACLQTLSQVLTTTGPFPADQANNGNTNANRDKPYDWVLVNPALHALETGATVGNHVFGHGLVVDTRVYTPISDLAPAVVGDSGAAMMQHMGVVRDFALAGAPPPPQPTVQVTAPNGGETWAAGSSQTIRWTASGVTNVSVELSLDGTTFSTLSASTPAAAGQLVVTAPMVMTAAARIRVTAVPGGTPSDVSDAPFMITLAPPPVGRVFLNEVFANEPGSDVTREFVELVNSGSGDANLAGWTIADAVSVHHTFAAGTVLRAGQAIVVFGSAAGIPAGLGNAIGSSTGQLNLSNGGDTVTLASPTATIDSVTYTSTIEGVSINRNPDGSATGTFVLHTTLTTAGSSPGTRANGAAF